MPSEAPLKRDVRWLKAYALGSTLVLVVLLGTALQNDEENEQSGRVGAYRVFVGADRQDNAIVRLNDSKSNVRLRMQVDSVGTPSIEFLNTDGDVTRRLTGQSTSGK
jgi:hypothetical protein